MVVLPVKKKAAALLALLLSVCFCLPLFGCGGASSEQNILTLRMGNTVYPEFEAALTEAFPDIRFEITHYTGEASTAYLNWSLQSGCASDLYFTDWVDTADVQQAYLLDLSGYEFVGNYTSAMLDVYNIDGHVYELPGPYTLRTVAYNKTLFAEMDWQVPKSHQELVALCRRIRQESSITPIVFAGELTEYCFTYMATLAQGGFLSTPNREAWETAYLAGEASAEEGFAEGIQALSELTQAGAFDGQKTPSLDVASAAKELVLRNAAMMAVFSSSDNVLDAINRAGSTDTFGMMPFYGINGTPVLGTMPNIQFGISKRLSEPGNRRKLQNALRVMEWLSAPEVMDTFRTSNTMIIPLRDAAKAGLNPIMQEVMNVYAGGYRAVMMYNGYKDVIAPAGAEIQKAIASGGDFSQVIPTIDRVHRQGGTVTYGEIARDFSLSQTAQALADAIAASGLADFALVTAGEEKSGLINRHGCAGPLFAGPVEDQRLYVPLPAGDTEIYVVTLDVQQVKTLLERGKEMGNPSGVMTAFPYAWSGVEVIWQGDKAVSLEKDGRELDGSCRVAFLADDYPAALSGNAEASGTPAASVWEAYLAAHSPLAPADRAGLAD